ncbi:putative acetyltransferase [Desulfosporosinus sp. I2]|uniref:GNAT family N-acetyltransferase n=1 Tax=Desulfosporosinus sp. I2 TaxID=1617025 RepID=UPI0005EE4A78|nr:GNAT family N-acetyltransferase [Desulfosporosinus sp. I2]KJR48843.1 putative acetyltransferase [Desulfosporosinus sp. I2]
MMRIAELADIKQIMAIIQATIIEMRTYNNTQWDETYPQEKDFVNDIREGNLYVSERDSQLVAFVCVNKVEPDEYEELNWTSKNKAMVIHRMAVAPQHRRKGIGKELMKFAEDLSLQNNITYLKTDTNSLNEKMNVLFIRCGYTMIGEMSFLGKETPFYAYEKALHGTTS